MQTSSMLAQPAGSSGVDAAESGPRSLPQLTLAFAVLSVVFFLLLIFLRIPFPAYPLMSYQDALDLLTPLVLIPIYWLLFKAAARQAPSAAQEVVFMVLAAVWVLGQGMHLAANSINNLAEGLARQGELDITGTSVYQLTYFYDEVLSHYLWHGGVIALAVLLMQRAWKEAGGTAAASWPVIAGGLLYGIMLFCIFLEGQTVRIGLPFVALVTLTCLMWARAKLRQSPLLLFFFISCALALILFAGWRIYWGDFRELTAAGLI